MCIRDSLSTVLPEPSSALLQAVIFDVDGTLADTEGNGHRVAFNRAFEKLDLNWHWTPEFYGELLTVTGGKERIDHYVDRYDPDRRNRPDFDLWVRRLYPVSYTHLDVYKRQSFTHALKMALVILAKRKDLKNKLFLILFFSS